MLLQLFLKRYIAIRSFNFHCHNVLIIIISSALYKSLEGWKIISKYSVPSVGLFCSAKCSVFKMLASYRNATFLLYETIQAKNFPSQKRLKSKKLFTGELFNELDEVFKAGVGGRVVVERMLLYSII